MALPTWETAQDETDASMQRIVDALPTDVRVEDLTVARPYPCGDGFMYTAHWAVYLPSDFDGRGFLRDLPAAVGDGFELADPQPPSENAKALLATELGQTLVTVSDVSDLQETQENVLDLLAQSRCAQGPEN